MNELSEYFEDEGTVEPDEETTALPADPAPRKKLPPCTDTAGEPISRPGHAAFQRILMTPVNCAGEKPNSYALVYCQQVGAGVMREGTNIRNAVFCVFTEDDSVYREYREASGRDKAIQHLLRILRGKKKYH